MSRDIVINPNRDLTGGTQHPEIRFSGLNEASITLKVEDDGSLVFEGDTGGLFYIEDDKDGLLNSVNDISGLPIFSVYSDNRIEMGKWDDLALTIIDNQAFVGPTGETTSLFHISGGSLTIIGDLSGGTEGGVIYSGGTDLYDIFATEGELAALDARVVDVENLFSININFESVYEYNFIAPYDFIINTITGTTAFSAVSIYNVTQATGTTTGDTVVQYDSLIISSSTIGLVVINSEKL